MYNTDIPGHSSPTVPYYLDYFISPSCKLSPFHLLCSLGSLDSDLVTKIYLTGNLAKSLVHKLNCVEPSEMSSDPSPFKTSITEINFVHGWTRTRPSVLIIICLHLLRVDGYKAKKMLV